MHQLETQNQLQLTDQREEYRRLGYGRSILDDFYPLWRALDSVRQHLIGLQTPVSSSQESSVRDLHSIVGRKYRVDSIEDALAKVRQAFPGVTRQGSVGAWSFWSEGRLVGEAWLPARGAGWWLRVADKPVAGSTHEPDTPGTSRTEPDQSEVVPVDD